MVTDIQGVATNATDDDDEVTISLHHPYISLPPHPLFPPKEVVNSIIVLPFNFGNGNDRAELIRKGKKKIGSVV